MLKAASKSALSKEASSVNIIFSFGIEREAGWVFLDEGAGGSERVREFWMEKQMIEAAIIPRTAAIRII